MRDVPLYAAIGLLLLLVAFPVTQTSSAELKTVTFSGMTLSEETAKLLKGGCEQIPYTELEKFKRGSVLLTPRWVGGKPEAGIDPALACRILKMLEFAVQKGCRPTISSGYRSAATQQKMCGSGRDGCAPAGTSCHQYGLAVDINAPCLGWLKQIAPRFNLIQNPIPGDPYHFQCAEHRGASRRSCTGPCNGGIAINPDLNGIAPYQADGAPMGLGDMARQAIYGQQQQPPPPPMQQQQLPTSQNPTNYFPTTPTVPTIPTIPATTSTSTASTTLYTSGTSVADYLLMLAYGTTSYGQSNTKTTNATTIPLVIGANDTVGLQGSHTQIGDTVTMNQIQPTYQQPQTFTSGGTSYPEGAQDPQQMRLVGILMQLRDALAQLLNILRPFGIRDALHGVEAEEEHMHE